MIITIEEIVQRQTFSDMRGTMRAMLEVLDGKEQQLVFLYATAVSNSITAVETLGVTSPKTAANARDQKFIEDVIVGLLKLTTKETP